MSVMNGFRAELVRQGFAEGKDVAFDDQHVNFDRTLIPQLLTNAASKKPAMIVDIGREDPVSLAVGVDVAGEADLRVAREQISLGEVGEILAAEVLGGHRVQVAVVGHDRVVDDRRHGVAASFDRGSAAAMAVDEHVARLG